MKLRLRRALQQPVNLMIAYYALLLFHVVNDTLQRWTITSAGFVYCEYIGVKITCYHSRDGHQITLENKCHMVYTCTYITAFGLLFTRQAQLLQRNRAALLII